MTRIGITAGATRKKINAATSDLYNMADKFALPIEAVRSGLDTLTASGMSLDEAMEFLPSVLATAQASGAAVEDIANTAIKTSSALKISTKDLQMMFDILNTGGKLGQFELRDMASYIPELSNSFANLGYSGLEGTQKLVALLQTLRARTGTAEAAKTQAGEIFGKALAPGQINNFNKNFDFDIENKMAKALKNGEDFLEAYVRLSREALGGDLSKIGQLFTDKEMRQGMTTLLSDMDSYTKYLKDLKGSDVAGSTMRDLNEVLKDQEATLQRLSNEWNRFLNTLGGAVSGPVGSVLKGVTNYLDFERALEEGREKLGKSKLETFLNLPGANARIARAGGYAPDEKARADLAQAPHAYEVLGYLPYERRKSTVTRSMMKAPEIPTGFDPTMVPRADASGAFGIKPERQKFGESATVMNMIAGMSARLNEMTGKAPVDAKITDAHQDNRNQSITVGGTIVNVASPTNAPKAVGDAVSATVAAGVAKQAARIQQEPAQ